MTSFIFPENSWQLTNDNKVNNSLSRSVCGGITSGKVKNKKNKHFRVQKISRKLREMPCFCHDVTGRDPVDGPVVFLDLCQKKFPKNCRFKSTFHFQISCPSCLFRPPLIVIVEGKQKRNTVINKNCHIKMKWGSRNGYSECHPSWGDTKCYHIFLNQGSLPSRKISSFYYLRLNNITTSAYGCKFSFLACRVPQYIVFLSLTL